MCFGRQKFGDFRIWIPGSCSSRYSPPISYRPKNDNFEYLAIDAPFKRYGFYFSSGYDCYTYQKDAPNYKKAEFVCKSNNRIKLLYTESVWQKQKWWYFLMEIPDDAGEFHSHSGRIVISEKLTWEDQGFKILQKVIGKVRYKIAKEKPHKATNSSGR